MIQAFLVDDKKLLPDVGSSTDYVEKLFNKLSYNDDICILAHHYFYTRVPATFSVFLLKNIFFLFFFSGASFIVVFLKLYS